MVVTKTFRRIADRVGFEMCPEWLKGYKFKSNDYELTGDFGYVIDFETGNNHDITKIEEIIEE